jgi:hypothetical protein
MLEILIAIVLVVILWRVMLLLGVPGPTAEIILLLMLVVVILGGGTYVGTGHHLLIN